jgi:hypothetical protein
MSDSRAGEDTRAIRDLVDGWAHCADRRLPEQQADLFVPDGEILVFNDDPATSDPVQHLRGRTEMVEAFAVLEQYEATTHFNGQSTIDIDRDTASAESYCLAHHFSTEEGARQLMVMSIRYLDRFVRTDAGWRFSQRRLLIDWTDTRPSSE